MKEKTIADFIETDPKELAFSERVKKYEEEMKPVSEKWGVAPWAGLTNTNEIIAAVPQLKDLWPKEDAVQPTEAA